MTRLRPRGLDHVIKFPVMLIAVLLLAGWLALAMPMQGQLLHPNGPLPSYEVATIKPSSGGLLPLGGLRDVARFSGTTRMYIQQAFRVPPGSDTRVVGGPSWVDSDRYVIEGKYPAEYIARIPTLPLAQRLTETGLMQQSLLADRFKLKMHFEVREMPIYELVVAKGGPKLTPAKNLPVAPGATAPTDAAGAPRPPVPPGPAGIDPTSMRQGIVILPSGNGTKLTAKGMTLDSMLEMPRFSRDHPIVNKTGLTDRYDFTLEWSQLQTGAADNGAVSPDAGPSLFTAFEEQLGLKLVLAKGMVEVVVIDSIDHPTEN